MAEYRLTVVKLEPNPRYGASFLERLDIPGPHYEQARHLETRLLEVVLTEREYQGMKEAVIEMWDQQAERKEG